MADGQLPTFMGKTDKLQQFAVNGEFSNSLSVSCCFYLIYADQICNGERQMCNLICNISCCETSSIAVLRVVAPTN